MSERARGVSICISIEATNDLLNLSVREVLEKKQIAISEYDEADYWYREIIYCVEPSQKDRIEECENCGERLESDWSYCPYCGEEPVDPFCLSETYKTRSAALRSENYKKWGITEKMVFGVRKRPKSIPAALG